MGGIDQIRTAVAPLILDSALLHYLYALDILVHTNHPHTDTDVHTSYSPFCTMLYKAHDRAAGTDMYFLDTDVEVVDVLLPLAAHYARKVVVARVPLSWLTAPTPHRLQWLWRRVWNMNLGLCIRVLDKHGTEQPMVWFIIFKDESTWYDMTGARLDRRWSCCWWNAAYPDKLYPGPLVARGPSVSRPGTATD